MGHLLLRLFALLLCIGCRSTREEPRSVPSSTPVLERVRVTAPGGAPIVDASAVLISSGYSALEGTPEAPLRADGRGEITTSRAFNDGDILLVWAPGRAARRFELTADTTQPRAVELQEANSISGTIVGGGEARVDEIWLHSGSAPWPYYVRCAVDASRRFRVNGLAAGTYSVTARPTGGAPVLAASEDGRVTLAALDPGMIRPAEYFFLDGELKLGGRDPSVVRVAFGDTPVRGRVIDAQGGAIAGARVHLRTAEGREVSTHSDANGGFAAKAPPTSWLHISASHEQFGGQWTDESWSGWVHGGKIPEEPVTLTLRRGVVLRGRLLRDGAPVANEIIYLIPAYTGSGPPTVEATTDSRGVFAFPRLLLASFELVPKTIDNWMPRLKSGTEGDFLRISGPPSDEMLRDAAADRPVEIRLESYKLLQISLDLVDANGSPLASEDVHVWTRGGAYKSFGAALTTDARGRVSVTMERGAPYELWVERRSHKASLEAPWGHGAAPLWKGTPAQATTVKIGVSAQPR